MKIKSIIGNNGIERKRPFSLGGLSSTVSEKNKYELELQKLRGPKGEKGDSPVKGVDYFDGKDGKNGNDGYTPIKNIDYFDGKDGYTPIKGVDYFDGKNGEKGDKGEKGDPGKDGKSIKGEKGDPGENGVTTVITKEKDISGSEIARRIEKLEGDDRLDVEKLKNLEKIVQWARAGIGGETSDVDKLSNRILPETLGAAGQAVYSDGLTPVWGIPNFDITLTYTGTDVTSISKVVNGITVTTNLAYEYTNGLLTKLTKTVDGVSQEKVFTYTGTQLTNISPWV